MRVIFKEPLVHFLIGAVTIFVFFSFTGNGSTPQSISLTEAQINRLQANWFKSWRRPATDAEMAALVQSHIDDELLYQEALNLNLDIDDAVVRNRMIQKMRFLHDESTPEPTDKDLEKWLAANPNKYQADDKLSFEQIFLGEQLNGLDTNNIVKQLNSGEAVSHKDFNLVPLLNLPQQWQQTSVTEIERRFGNDFTDQLKQTKEHEWVAAVRSGYGYHAVRVTALHPSLPAQLNHKQVRQNVQNDWRNEQRTKNRREKLDQLRSQYRIDIDHWPSSSQKDVKQHNAE